MVKPKLLEEIRSANPGVSADLQRERITDDVGEFLMERLRYPEQIVKAAGKLSGYLGQKLYEKGIEKLGMRQCYYYLGEIYLKGTNGIYDFEKAFRCFMMAAEAEEGGDGLYLPSLAKTAVLARLKIAGMYRDGLFVERNEKRHDELIRKIYEEVRTKDYSSGRPEAALEMIELNIDNECDDVILELFTTLLDDSLEGMERKAGREYAEMFVRAGMLLSHFESEESEQLAVFDLYRCLEDEQKITFTYNGQCHCLQLIRHPSLTYYCLDEQKFASLTDLLISGVISGETIGSLLNRISDWRLVKEQECDADEDEVCSAQWPDYWLSEKEKNINKGLIN